MNLADRGRVTQATYDKYRGRAFDWKGATCVHLLRFHLRGMGYKPMRVPPFQSPIGAKRALKSIGASDLIEMMDRLGLSQKPAAFARVGDVGILPGDDGIFDAIVICAGRKWFGWHGAAEGLGAMDDVISAMKAVYHV